MSDSFNPLNVPSSQSSQSSEEEWCNPDCEAEEGCIKCNPFAYQSQEQFDAWFGQFCKTPGCSEYGVEGGYCNAHRLAEKAKLDSPSAVGGASTMPAPTEKMNDDKPTADAHLQLTWKSYNTIIIPAAIASKLLSVHENSSHDLGDPGTWFVNRSVLFYYDEDGEEQTIHAKHEPEAQGKWPEKEEIELH